MSLSTGDAAWALVVVGVMGAAALLARKTANSLQSQQFNVPSSYWNDQGSETPTISPPGSHSGGIFLDWASIEPDQMTSALETVAVSLDPSTYRPANVPANVAATNVRAFLDMIAFAEGADYNVQFGGGRFASYADHPRQVITRPLGGREISSSAAGRYQFLARTWDGLVRKLGLPDFSPASQDAGAIELIRERGALNDVKAGRFVVAVDKVRKVWASMPGAGYDQPEKSIDRLAQVFRQSGGVIEGQA